MTSTTETGEVTGTKDKDYNSPVASLAYRRSFCQQGLRPA